MNNRQKASGTSDSLWENTAILLILPVIFTLSGFLAQAAQAAPEPATQPHIVRDYGRLPLYFEPNQGQTDESVKFFSRGRGYGLFLTAGEVVLTLHQPDPFAKLFDLTGLETDFGAPLHAKRDQRLDAATLTSVVRTTFPGAIPAADLTVEGLEPLPGRSNYFIGNDPAKWHTDVPHYGRVRYRNLYPGIDLVLYGNPQQLEYDL
jgi:hypothetical protein